MPPHIILLITLAMAIPLCEGNRTYEFLNLVATTSIQYLTSPGYPASYPSNHTSEWLISTDYANHTVKLEVVDCSVEYEKKQSRCLYEKIYIYDGNGTKDKALTPNEGYCCVPVPDIFSSTQSQIFINFFTDDSNVDKGFNISFFSDGPTTTTQTTTTTTTTTTSTTTTTTMPITTSVVTWTPSSTTTTPSTSTTDTTTSRATTWSATVTTCPTTITTLTTIPSMTTTIQSTPKTGTILTTTFPLTLTTPSTDSTTPTTTTTTATKSGTMTSVSTKTDTDFSTDTTTTSVTTSNSPAGTNSLTSFTSSTSTTSTNSAASVTSNNSAAGLTPNENWKYIIAGCVSGIILLSVIITTYFCYLYYKKVSTVHVQKQRPISVSGVRASSFEANQKVIHMDANPTYVPDTGENNCRVEQNRNPVFEIDSPIGKANLLPPIESRLV